MFDSAKDALTFILGGKAHFTVVSKKTGTRFTYRVRVPKNSNNSNFFFVDLLCGPDNTSNYRYIGQISNNNFSFGRRSMVKENSPGVVAFSWVWRILNSGELHESLEIFHEGRCGRCARMLTVPESIKSGFGPECVKKAIVCE